MSLFIDIHVLQTLPPSNPNRDDTGAPKSATFGGVSRMRISSQAIKRATRQDFEKKISNGNYGVRTKLIVDLVARAIVAKRPDLEAQAADLAAMGLKAIGFKLAKPRGNKSEKQLKEAEFLVFLSAKQIDHVAEALVSVAGEDDPEKAFKALKPRNLVDTDHSIDIALFGRMVAEPNSLNVDAACQVAHAIGVGAVEREYDYYTAVDDEKRQDDEADAGAGMIGTIEFASATVYRYATINVELLLENLGAAFEEPIVAAGEGFATPAIKRFVEFESQLRELTGMDPVSSIVSWTTPRGADFDALGDQVSLAELGGATAEVVRAIDE